MNFKLKNTNLSPTQIVSSDTSQKSIFNSDTIQNIPIESDTTQLVDNMTLVYNSNDNKWVYSLPNSYIGQVYYNNIDAEFFFFTNPNIYYNMHLSSNMILSSFSNGYTNIENGLACIKYEGNLNNILSMHNIYCSISNISQTTISDFTFSIIVNPTFNENGEVLTGTYLEESIFTQKINLASTINSINYNVSFIVNEQIDNIYYLVFKTSSINNLNIRIVSINWSAEVINV